MSAFPNYAKPVPMVGDDIYVETNLYLSHGSDDFIGGLGRVSKVKEGISGGRGTHYVSVEERPGYSFNWAYLAEKQDTLKREFGNNRSYKDPDDREEFNRWD